VRRVPSIAIGTVLGALLAGVVWTQGRIDARLGSFRVQDEVLYLWSGEHVRRVWSGFEGIAADLYWLRTVQYFGGQRLFARTKRFELLRPLIEITTTLDPRLEIAYRYGAVFLSEVPPIGAGRPQEGIEVLEKGARALPDSWRLRQDLGFFHYLYLGDAETSSRVLTEAADIPGAAFWLRSLAADILGRSGDRLASRRMWRQMYEQAEEGVLRANAALRLRILDALDQADHLTAAAAEFERRVGRRPSGLAELRGSGLARGPLVDPEGVAFDYDATSGRVSVARTSPLWRPDWRPGAGGP
jgi:hypothetical protein